MVISITGIAVRRNFIKFVVSITYGYIIYYRGIIIILYIFIYHGRIARTILYIRKSNERNNNKNVTKWKVHKMKSVLLRLIHLTIFYNKRLMSL